MKFPVAAGNERIATRLDEVAALLHQQGANPFRVDAYRRAAGILRSLPDRVEEIVNRSGVDGLEVLPGIGPALARAIQELVRTGRLPLLDRLRGDLDPVALLSSVPGIGRATAARLVHGYLISTLEDLEVAAHDGRLARLGGFGEKRLAAIRDTLATRLGRRPSVDRPLSFPPAVAELLNVDTEYREGAMAGRLARIAPRRFNPRHAAWLPLLHTTRGDRQYTAVYSNTARAHQLGMTHDWVVLYCDGSHGDHQYTVITANIGPLRGRRVVRGREAECVEYYRGLARAPEQPREAEKSAEQLEMTYA